MFHWFMHPNDEVLTGQFSIPMIMSMTACFRTVGGKQSAWMKRRDTVGTRDLLAAVSHECCNWQPRSSALSICDVMMLSFSPANRIFSHPYEGWTLGVHQTLC